MSDQAAIDLHAVAVAYERDDVEGFARGLARLRGRAVDETWPLAPLDLTRRPLIGLAAVYDELCAPDDRRSAIGRWLVENALDEEVQSLVERELPSGAPGSSVPPTTAPMLLRPVEGWGAIAALTLHESAEHEVQDGAGSRLDVEPAPGLQRALRGAREQVSHVLQTVENEWTIPVDLGLGTTVAAPSEPHPSTMQVNLALALLAREVGLPPAAAEKILAIGRADGDGYEPEPDTELERAAADLGWRVVRRVGDGWDIDGRHEPGVDLVALARCVWGGFDDVLGQLDRERVLEQTRWEIDAVVRRDGKLPKGSAETAPPQLRWFAEPSPPSVSVPTAGTIAGAFLACTTAARVLAGRRNSGKSTIARQVARLLKSSGWNIVVIRPESRSLTATVELTDIIAGALHRAKLPDRRGDTLVVIEDLLPIEGGELGTAISEAAAANGVGILALARYGRESAVDWETETVAPLNAVQTTDQVRRFADELLKQQPGHYRLPDGWSVDEAVTRSRLDLRLLTRLLRRVPRPSGMAGPAVRRLMALSIIDESMPVRALTSKERAEADAWGAVVERGAIGFPGRLTDGLGSSPSDSEAGAGHLAEAIAWAIESRIGKGDLGVRYLVRSFAATVPELVEQVFADESVSGALDRWLAQCDLGAGADALGVLQRVGGAPLASDRIDRLVARLVKGEARMLPAPLNRLARVLDERERLRPTRLGLDPFVEWLGGRNGLAWTLDGGARFSARCGLAQTLLRLGHRDVALIMAANLDDFFRQIDNRRSVDLRCLWEMDLLVRRLASRLRRQRAEVPVPDLRAIPRVAELLARGQGAGTGFAERVMWLALRTRRGAGYTDWEGFLEDYARPLVNALPTSVGRQISASLAHLAAVNRGFANKLLNEMRGAELAVNLGEVVVRETPAEAAELLRTVANVHFAVAKDVLYQGDAPRDELARQLASAVRKASDIKGASMLLSAAHKIDALQATSEGTFANLLAEYIGEKFVEDAMAQENRPSVLAHLVEGLWSAEASYRQNIKDRALRLAVEGIARPSVSVRMSAPRLALLLLDDEHFGQEALTYLRDEISAEQFIGHLTSGYCSLDALVPLHRLARVLYPASAEEVLRGSRRQVVPRRVAASRAVTLADYLRELALTLRLGGMPDPASDIRRWLAGAREPGSLDHPGEASYWSKRISRMAYEPSVAAATLTSLTLFDVRLAEEVVELLDKPTETEPGGRDDAPASTELQRLLRNATAEPDSFAALLSALRKVRRELGRALLDELRNSTVQVSEGVTAEWATSQAWDEFLDNFRYEQNTLTQVSVGVRLARLAFDSSSGDARGVLQHLVLRRWLPTVHLVPNPRVVASMLRAAYMWNPTWATQLATQVNVPRIGARLRRAWVDDLDALPLLLRSVAVARPSGVADVVELVIGLDRDGVPLGGRMSLDMLTSLVAFDALPKPVRGSLQVQLAERIERELGRVALADPAEHWFAIGGACSVLERSGRVELVPDVRLPAHLGIGVPAEYLWATCWHEADDTRRVALGAVWEDYRARSGLRLGADARAMALVGGVRSGLLTPAQVVEDEGRWGELVNARQDILAAVWRLGDGTPELAHWLARLEDGLRQRLAAAGMGVFDGHRELLQRLGVARPAPELSQDGAKLLL